MRSYARLLALVALIATLFAAAAIGMPHSPAGLRALVVPLGWAAPIAFVLLWAALTPALFPGTVLAAGSGLLFGTALGTAVSVAGATLGSALAFALARRLGRTAAEELEGPRVARLQERIERRGFVSVLYARLAPGVPVTLLNYAGGLSRVRPRDFIAAIAVGGAPRAFAYTALGGSFGDYGSPAAIIAISLIVLPAIAGAALLLRSRLRAGAAAI
jgi:uncharacterized membrane protein YdjX (TVP38/TMEM64 family)